MDMQEINYEMVPNKEKEFPARTEEEIRVIMDTIRMYLEQTKEVIEQIEKFVKELTGEKVKSDEKQINPDNEKKPEEIPIFPGI